MGTPPPNHRLGSEKSLAGTAQTLRRCRAKNITLDSPNTPRRVWVWTFGRTRSDMMGRLGVIMGTPPQTSVWGPKRPFPVPLGLCVGAGRKMSPWTFQIHQVCLDVPADPQRPQGRLGTPPQTSVWGPKRPFPVPLGLFFGAGGKKSPWTFQIHQVRLDFRADPPRQEGRLGVIMGTPPQTTGWGPKRPFPVPRGLCVGAG